LLLLLRGQEFECGACGGGGGSAWDGHECTHRVLVLLVLVFDHFGFFIMGVVSRNSVNLLAFCCYNILHLNLKDIYIYNH